jgi:hypothetical protein
MAKIHEEVVVIKLSMLVKDGEETANIVTDETLTAIEQVTQELVSRGAVVEVERA